MIAWITFIISTIYYFNLSITKNVKPNNAGNDWFSKIVNFMDQYQIEASINFGETFSNVAASKFIMIGVLFGEINIFCCIIGDFIANFSEFCDLLCTERKKETRKQINCCGVILLIVVFIYRLICYIIKIAIGIFIFHISLIPFLHGIDR